MVASFVANGRQMNSACARFWPWVQFAVALFLLAPTDGGAASPPILPNPLPTLSAQRFSIGETWIWVYDEQGDRARPYSFERYEVIARQGPVVTFEMSSRYSPEGEWFVHHRLIADVEECLAARSQPRNHRSWSVILHRWNGEGWEVVGPTANTEAFEEKFNCDPHVHIDHPVLETRFSPAEPDSPECRDTFQQWDHRQPRLEPSWYCATQGVRAGVALKKEFHPGTNRHYRMRLWSAD